jgi:hypothetical protein
MWRHFVLALLSLATASAGPRKVENLPGLPASLSHVAMHADYVHLPSGKSLFFWLVDSLTAPSADPLLLWLNGGPGCSSLYRPTPLMTPPPNTPSEGLLGEHGPFVPTADGTLRENPFAWNRFANVLYLESPAGVGFSVASDPSLLKTGDRQTALDVVDFLRAFFAAFPSLAGRDFWIAGERSRLRRVRLMRAATRGTTSPPSPQPFSTTTPTRPPPSPLRAS